VIITEWIEFAAAKSAKSDQRQWKLGLSIPSSGSGSAAEDVSQQNVNQFSPPRANFSAAGAGLVLQTQAMLFNLENLFIRWKDLGRAFAPGRGEPTFGVSQNLFQMSGHCHHELRL